MDLLWLGEPGAGELALVGGKVANLSRLASRYRVPPGFCLTTAVLGRRLEGTEDGCSTLRQLLAAAYRELGERCGVAEPSVAVRSSAVDEDGQSASFAGQHETYLNVVGVDALVMAVERCWASALSERALEYRRQQGLSPAGARLAVLVQQLVPADVSAVVFSANPVTNDRDEVLINASWGLGESVVGGTVTPDAYVVRKHDLAVVSRQIADKRRMTVAVSLAPPHHDGATAGRPDSGIAGGTEAPSGYPGRRTDEARSEWEAGTREVDVPRLLRLERTLDDRQATEMAELALALESEMGWPVDVECAFAGGALYLLQCRPITTLAREPALETVGSAEAARERIGS
ncbi:MAG: PEP/pyruvate-binding domain-containing protein [Chloroflexi bacterium]|nr:PEP/pyruvate-binding domain-containing protein [Chloroflexota bacterium]